MAFQLKRTPVSSVDWKIGVRFPGWKSNDNDCFRKQTTSLTLTCLCQVKWVASESCLWFLGWSFPWSHLTTTIIPTSIHPPLQRHPLDLAGGNSRAGHFKHAFLRASQPFARLWKPHGFIERSPESILWRGETRHREDVVGELMFFFWGVGEDVLLPGRWWFQIYNYFHQFHPDPLKDGLKPPPRLCIYCGHIPSYSHHQDPLPKKL